MKTRLLDVIVALTFGTGIVTAAPLGTAFPCQGSMELTGATGATEQTNCPPSRWHYQRTSI